MINDNKLFINITDIQTTLNRQYKANKGRNRLSITKYYLGSYLYVTVKV